MKPVPASLLIIVLGSCTITRLENKLTEKGYNVRKDTISIQPYEYVIINGYTPLYEECTSENKLNVKISIKGYENTEYIPLSALKDSIQFVLSDSSIKKLNGKIRCQLHGIGYWQEIETNNIGNYKISIARFVKKEIKKLRPEYVVYFFCINVTKGDMTYAIPGRKYFIR